MKPSDVWRLLSSARRIAAVSALLTFLPTVLLTVLLVPHASANTRAASTADVQPHAVVLGVAGLTWDDINQTTTPQLWDLASESAIGSLVTRGVYQRTCASDGWLTIGAGARAVAPRNKLPDGVLACQQVPQPQGSQSGWQIPNWDAITAENVDRYNPNWGVLADSVSATGGCSTAVGPGAALMLADKTGHIDRYVSNEQMVTRALLRQCSVTGIDLGQVAPAPNVDPTDVEGSGQDSLAASRAQSLRLLDSEVGQIRSLLPANATVLLVSTADETLDARLRVMTALGPGGGVTYESGLLTSQSTRHDGLLQLTDVTPTILNSVYATPIAPIAGTAPTVDTIPRSTTDRIAGLIEYDQRAQVMVQITFPVNQAIVVMALLTYVAFGLVGWLSVRRQRARGLDASVSVKLRHRMRNVSLLLASIPVSTYLINFVPWWRLADETQATPAIVAMLAGVAAIALLIAAIAVWLPALQRPYRPVMFIATTTLAVLAADVVTGSSLQFATVLGLSPIAAGRFYGFGNVAFSVFATAAIFVGIGVSAYWVRRGSRAVGSLCVALLGIGCALLDGLPMFGADFGGMIALIAGFGVFAVLVTGRELSWRIIALTSVLGLAFAFAVSFADYLRPAGSRTHLGDFIATLLTGAAWPTIQRKLLASAKSFTFSWAAPFIPIFWLAFSWITLQPQRFKAHALVDIESRIPTFRAGLLSGLLIAALGAVVNDSGAIVTATMLGVGLPLAVAAAAERVQPATSAPKSTTSVGPDPSAR